MSNKQIAEIIRKEASACQISSKLSQGNPLSDSFYGCFIVLTSLADRFDKTGLHDPKPPSPTKKGKK